MSADECWQLIADCTLKEDWIGVLAAADELPEDVRTAIRWAIGRRWFPLIETLPNGYQGQVRFEIRPIDWVDSEVEYLPANIEGVRKGWLWVYSFRQDILSHLVVQEYIG